MKFAVISDVHANETALRRVLADAAREGAHEIVSLGDVVGYGPMPRETIRLVRGSAKFAVAGNHDDAGSGRTDAKDFIGLAQEAVLRHRAALDAGGLHWRNSLAYTCEFGYAIGTHGDFTAPQRFLYIENEADAAANFAATSAQLMFVGHTHVPGVFLTGQSGRVYSLPPQDFTMECGKRYIVNPGSVGYPRERDGKCMASYVIYDSAERTVSFRFLPFSVASVMQRGYTPKRHRALPTIAAAAAIAAVAAVVAYRSRPMQAQADAVTTERPAAGEASNVVEKKSVTIGTGMRHVRANLLIAHGEPAILTVTYRNALGETMAESPREVKKTDRRLLTVPDGAVTATFTVSRTSTGGRPAILKFAPKAEQ